MLRSICTRTWSGRPMFRGCRATCTSLASKVSLYCFGGAAVWLENRTIGAAVLSALVKYRQLCTLSLLGSLPLYNYMTLAVRTGIITLLLQSLHYSQLYSSLLRQSASKQ